MDKTPMTAWETKIAKTGLTGKTISIRDLKIGDRVLRAGEIRTVASIEQNQRIHGRTPRGLLVTCEGGFKFREPMNGTAVIYS